MKNMFYLLYASLLIIKVTQTEFEGIIEEIPTDIATKMIGCSLKSDCPVPLKDLRYLTMSYWNYDEEEKTGHMVVHAKIANEIIDIFHELYDEKFPIANMELIDDYNADDNRSMAANNSSAFCCRAITNVPGQFSLHSYGIAIDINPLINPYVKGEQVLPENGRAYLDRTQTYKGIITKASDNVCYHAFIKRGYEWGGDWITRVDYQHFQKPISTITD